MNIFKQRKLMKRMLETPEEFFEELDDKGLLYFKSHPLIDMWKKSPKTQKVYIALENELLKRKLVDK